MNVDNGFEHIQERAPWAAVLPMSTSTPTFFFPGICDPTADEGTFSHHPNCSEASNDLDTGGTIFPSNETRLLFEKASDIGVLLKPIYESNQDIVFAGVYFRNQGAGAGVVFPGVMRDSRSAPYRSSGCDWMNNLNPYTGEPMAPPEEVAKCHPAGSFVHQREYNPLERAWFGAFARDPTELNWYGPYRSNDDGEPLLSTGRLVFDRVYVSAAIGCGRKSRGVVSTHT